METKNIGAKMLEIGLIGAGATSTAKTAADLYFHLTQWSVSGRQIQEGLSF